MTLHVLVADSGLARIFKVRGAPRSRTLTEVGRLERPSAHLPARALVTDRSGRVFDRAGRGGPGPPVRARHGAASDANPHAPEIDRFAARIGRALQRTGRDAPRNEIILIAEPRFLGVLRRRLPAAVRRSVRREVASDLARAGAAQILGTVNQEEKS